MILVTGAGGKTGRAIIQTLLARGEEIRALVYRPVDGLNVQETAVGDMRSPTILSRAMKGARTVYFIAPNMSPDEFEMALLAITTARSAGIEQFVYHSVLHPQTETMPHHWQKLRVEEKLLESGLPFTILQPAAYMQNILAQWSQIVDRGIYSVPYAAATRLSLVDLEDVAAAAGTILNQPAHYGATYELVGTHPLAQTDVAEILGQVLNRQVQVEMMRLDTWKRDAVAAGLGQYQVETLVSMFRYYDRFGFSGNPNVLNWLLGRPPTSFDSFVRRVVAAQSQ